MCLGITGKIIGIEDNPLGVRMGRVSFGGIIKEVCLAYTLAAQRERRWFRELSTRAIHEAKPIEQPEMT